MGRKQVARPPACPAIICNLLSISWDRKSVQLCLVYFRKHLKQCHTPARKLAFLTWLVITSSATAANIPPPLPRLRCQASMSFFMRNESLSSGFIQPSTIKLIPLYCQDWAYHCCHGTQDDFKSKIFQYFPIKYCSYKMFICLKRKIILIMLDQ